MQKRTIYFLEVYWHVSTLSPHLGRSLKQLFSVYCLASSTQFREIGSVYPRFSIIIATGLQNSMLNRNQVQSLYFLYNVYWLARWLLFTASKYLEYITSIRLKQNATVIGYYRLWNNWTNRIFGMSRMTCPRPCPYTCPSPCSCPCPWCLRVPVFFRLPICIPVCVSVRVPVHVRVPVADKYNPWIGIPLVKTTCNIFYRISEICIPIHGFFAGSQFN